MSALTKKKLTPRSKASPIVSGFSTMPMQKGLTRSPPLPSSSRSVSLGRSLRAAAGTEWSLRGWIGGVASGSSQETQSGPDSERREPPPRPCEKAGARRRPSRPPGRDASVISRAPRSTRGRVGVLSGASLAASSEGASVIDDSASSVSRCIELARDGSPDALGELLAAYRNYLRMIAVTSLDRQVQGKADASDHVQATLLKAHQNFRSCRGTTEQEWITWIRQILVNNLADLHRRFSLKAREVERERSLEATAERSSRMLRDLVPARAHSPSQSAQRRELGVIL